MEQEFDVEIKEVLSRVQKVKAESLDDAINKAKAVARHSPGVSIIVSSHNSHGLQNQDIHDFGGMNESECSHCLYESQDL